MEYIHVRVPADDLEHVADVLKAAQNTAASEGDADDLRVTEAWFRFLVAKARQRAARKSAA